MGKPGSGPDWIADEHGQASRPEQQQPGDSSTSVDPGEFIDTQSPLEDFLTNQEINRLLKGGKVTPNEAESIRRQTKNMNLLDRYEFFSAIDHGAERQGQEHGNSTGSILKKYGFKPKKFTL